MKILNILFLFIVTTTLALAQNQIFEGYAGLSWGSTIEEAMNKYEDLSEMTHLIDAFGTERVFAQNNITTARMFRFYDDQLYWGRTIYINPTSTTRDAIALKLVEDYGYFPETGEGSQENSSFFWAATQVSPSLYVEIVIYEDYSTSGRITGTRIHVTFINSLVSDMITILKVTNEKDRIEF